VTLYRVRCSSCDGNVITLYGRSLDEARAALCRECGKRMTVIGYESQITAGSGQPPGIETIGLSKERRAHVDKVSRGLVLSVFEKQP